MRGPALGRWLPWLLMAAVLSGALVVGSRGESGPPSANDRVRNIAASVRCPTCQGQSVLESDAPTARAIRTDISRRVDDGQSDDEIRGYLVSKFGDRILLTPPASGIAGLVWALPVTGLIVAAGGLLLAFRRWKGGGSADVTDADRALVDRARGRRTGPADPEAAT